MYEIKHLLKENFKNRIQKNGKIQLSSSKERSQYFNKKLVINKFLSLINGALEINRVRIATIPTQKSKNKRLAEKSKVSEQKRLRIIKLDENE